MRLCKRFVSLLLILCFALSMTAIGAAAVEAEPTEELEALEKLATNYVTAYIENIYLDGGNDLSKATIAELAADIAIDAALALPMEQQVLVGQELTTLSQLCGNISFLDETAQYYGYLHTAQDLVVEDFTLTTTILDHALEDRYASIHLYALAEFRYPGAEITSAAGDHYYVEFVKTNAGWTIVDMTVEFLEAYGVKQETFDLQASIQAADEAFRQPVVAAPPEPVEPQAITHGYTYNKNNAIAYSMVYTTSRNNDDKFDLLAFANTNFTFFTSGGDMGYNCQNYVSQCIWAGLGGSNTPVKISDGLAPMDTVGSSPSHQWYYKSSNSRTPSWTAVDAFLSYADASSEAEETGLRARIEQVGYKQNFSLSISQLLGSEIALFEVGESSPFHALIIVEANSQSRDGVYFNGNSPMRKYKQLSSEFPSNPMSVIVPTSMQVYGSCTHSYTNSGNWTGVICKSCGYNRMRITASMPHWGMFRTGTTWTVTGSVGFTCYRMAIGITDPSGKTTWTEYTNTSSVSRSYDFSQTGLYKIRISARNMPDSGTTASSSASTYYDYTIRTYS